MIIVIILLVVALGLAIGYAVQQRQERRECAGKVEFWVLENETLRLETETLRREKQARESSLVMVLAELDKSA